MALKSTVRAGTRDKDYLLVMDKKLDILRKKIWSTIFKEKGDITISDVAMVLGMVQYELIHHSDEKF